MKQCIFASMLVLCLSTGGCKKDEKKEKSEEAKKAPAAEVETKTEPRKEPPREEPREAPREAPKEARKVEPKSKLSDVTTEEIQSVAKAQGWEFVSEGGMEMGSLNNSKLTFKKGDKTLKIEFVRPTGKPDDPKSSMKPMPVEEQAKAFKGAVFVHSKSMLGVEMGGDKAAEKALLKKLTDALIKADEGAKDKVDKKDAAKKKAGKAGRKARRK